MNSLIEINHLTVSYGSVVAIENACMSIHENDFIGVIGPNGGGKTTLLKSILGLVEPSSGEIVFSKKLKGKGSHIGYLPQVNKFDNRFPISVLEVVMSGKLSGHQRLLRNSSQLKQKAMEVLNDLGIEKLASKSIGELSGGQMQKVFLGRALIADPQLLILDEPNTYVDNQFESELYEKLIELNKRMAILLVSHDVGTISSHVKSIACVSRELHYHPSNIISQEQLASYNCPIQMLTHGEVPHTVLGTHHHPHSKES
ncbi:MAG: metal ABC transporter ATP-binding protein [Prolixibacteraceae bacterium]